MPVKRAHCDDERAAVARGRRRTGSGHLDLVVDERSAVTDAVTEACTTCVLKALALRSQTARRERYRNESLHTNDVEREAFVGVFAAAPDVFTPIEREAVTAVYVDRRSLISAGVHLGVRTPTLKSRVGRARIKLHAWLERQASP